MPNLDGMKFACAIIGFAPIVFSFYLVSMILIRWANADEMERARRWFVASTTIFLLLVSIATCAVKFVVFD